MNLRTKLIAPVVAVSAIGLAACSTGHTATHSQPKAAQAAPVRTPAPLKAVPSATTYTITPPSSPAAPLTVTKTVSGTGQEVTSPIHFGCVMDGTPIKVKYSFTGSRDGLAAWLEDGNGVMVGDNNIVDSDTPPGRTTTDIYLDPDVAVPPFHLNVDADQGTHWSFRFTCDKA